MKRNPRPIPKAKSRANGNGLHPEKPRLRPVEELVQKICRNDHTKGILAR